MTVILTVGLGILKPPRWYVVLKENVNFTKSTILCLRKAKPTPDETKQIRSGIEKTCLRTPTPA
jgi:hypothetical protein